MAKRFTHRKHPDHVRMTDGSGDHRLMLKLPHSMFISTIFIVENFNSDLTTQSHITGNK